MDADGVKVYRTSSRRRTTSLVVAVITVPVLATLIAVVLIRHAPGASPSTPPGPTAARDAERAPAAANDEGAAPAAAPVEPKAGEAFTPRRRAAAAAAKPPSESDDKPELDAVDVIPELRAAGEHGGIAAFGLPGSDPPKPGIVVPEGFQLPEGYVRHYQVTDEGEQLPAILMFHPDYDFLDARGAPMKLPDDRVVPPAMAPPGLPIRMLEVPEKPAARDAAP